MGFNHKEFLAAAMILFAVIDIIGSIPVIIELKRKSGEIHPFKATTVALGIMIAFLILGESILKFIGIDVKAFAVAGSFILFFLSLEMILGIKLFKDDASSAKTISIVPIAFPIIAGAGTMTSIISLRAEFQPLNIGLAIVTNSILVYIVLRLTKKIEYLLGEAGIAILRKVFGIILLAIAVKLFSDNAKLLF